MELRGINSDSDDGSFDQPGYVSETRCILSPCEWTVVPAKASTYEFKAFLIDPRNDKVGGESDSVKLDWAAPPRPQAIKLFVNGETPPTTPLTDDDYSKFPAGPLQVEAKWTTDASGTGYYVKISADNRVYARCSTGTSCRVPGKVPLADNRLDDMDGRALDDERQQGRRRLQGLPRRRGLDDFERLQIVLNCSNGWRQALQ